MKTVISPIVRSAGRSPAICHESKDVSGAADTGCTAPHTVRYDLEPASHVEKLVCVFGYRNKAPMWPPVDVTF